MTPLAQVLERIEKEYKDEIWAKGSAYIIVDLGKAFDVVGIKDDVSLYTDVSVVVPLKRSPQGALPIFVNGSEFSAYSQLESGIAVPEWVAEKSGLDYKQYEPPEQMTLTLT